MHIYKETTNLFVTRVTMVLIAIQHKFYIERIYDDLETLRIGSHTRVSQETARGISLEILPKETCSIAF